MQRSRVFALSTAALFAVLGLSLSAHSHDHDHDQVESKPYPGTGIRTGVLPPGSRLGGSKSVEFPAHNVTLLSWLTLGDLTPTAHSGASCWGYTSPSGREYALMAVNSGTVFVEVTDPNNPVVVSFQSGPIHFVRDVETWSHYAYVCSDAGGGVQVFDMANIDAGIVTLAGTVSSPGDLDTYTVSIDTASGYLYRAGGGNNGVRIYDLNVSATNAPLVGQWGNMFIHEVTPVTYTSGPAAGKQIMYACTGFIGGSTTTPALSIVDVTNKASPIVLKQILYSGQDYPHQMWLSSDLKYAYLDDEGVNPTRTYVFDVQNPATTFLVGSFSNGNTATGHNLYTLPGLVLEANYRSGLRVFDTAANPINPPEIAWFDTYPEDDLADFNGLWSNYPYLGSGIVLGSDRERGLFVWWLGAPLLDVQPVGAGLSVIDPAGDVLSLTIDEIAPGTLVPGTIKLHWDAGTGVVTTDLVAMGGNLWGAVFPALPCGTSLAYFVSAESTNGITWSWPQGGSNAPMEALVATGVNLVIEDTLEVDSGWTVGIPGDDATSGHWLRVDPNGTYAQPQFDHTDAPGTVCFVTGQGAVNGLPGDADVDNGTTTLVSPVYDMSGLGEPVVGYWRWYSNKYNGFVDDSFSVQISNGGPWITVETVGPGGDQSNTTWFHHRFRVSQFVEPNASVRLRFRASDLGVGSIVEAAIDDLRVEDALCAATGGPVSYCTGKLNSQNCMPSIGFSGMPSAGSPGAFLITAEMVVPSMFGILFYGHGQNNVPFNGGTLCAASPIKRLPVQNSGGSLACGGTYVYDFNQVIQGGGDAMLVSGAQVNAQFWYRDPPSTFGSGLSDALEFVIQP